MPAESSPSQRPPLTSEQKRLVEQHLGLADRVAGMLRSQMPTIELGELVAYGFEGLINAAQRFDPSLGSFENYAFYRVKGAILEGVRKSGHYRRSDQKRYTAEEIIESYRQRQETLSETLERLAAVIAKDPAPRRVPMCRDPGLSAA
jgi:RNA polymerase sigma factor FliA